MVDLSAARTPRRILTEGVVFNSQTTILCLSLIYGRNADTSLVDALIQILERPVGAPRVGALFRPHLHQAYEGDHKGRPCTASMNPPTP